MDKTWHGSSLSEPRLEIIPTRKKLNVNTSGLVVSQVVLDKVPQQTWKFQYISVPGKQLFNSTGLIGKMNNKMTWLTVRGIRDTERDVWEDVWEDENGERGCKGKRRIILSKRQIYLQK